MALPGGTALLSDPVMALAVLGSVLVALPLAVLSVLAYFRRRTTPYLLVSTAFVALFVRTVAGTVSLFGLLNPRSHRLLGHGLDVGIAVCLLAAVVLARRREYTQVLSFEDG